MLGKETVYMLTNNVSRGQSPSYSQNTQKLGKELMTVDEIAVMDGAKCILQVRGVRPFLSRKYDITRHPLYKHLSDYDPRNAFDIEKFLNTKLKVRQNDMFEVYDIDLDETLPPDVFISE